MKISLLMMLFCIGLTALWDVSAAKSPIPFVLTIRALRPAMTVGSEVRVEVTLKNTSAREIGILQSRPEYDYIVEVRDAHGKIAPDTDFGRKLKAPDSVRIDGHAVLYTLKPQQTLKSEIIVSNLFQMAVPGRYVIQVTRRVPDELGGGIAKSNAVTVLATK